MKQLLFLVLIASSVATVKAQNNWCGFDHKMEKAISNDPSLIQDALELERQARQLTRSRLEDGENRSGGVRIIPTVFHVIHQGGDENISYEQIEDQMRILNEDYRRLNADASQTRAIFEPVAADANVEFRLAKLDPQGNCTDGVVRVWSSLTYNSTDAVKATSYWNSSKYLNVWVVASIDDEGEQGTTLGYAQFPGFGDAATDGVVVRADFIGSIGTAANTGYKGRVLTHEVGHWLGLFHTFQGGCTGGFPFGEGVDDTPPEAGASGSCSQNLNTCDNDNPDLPDQIENYMDYTPGSCQNMLTLGQKDRVDAVLSSSRAQIHSASNLAATGVDDPNETPCQPYAHFYAEETFVCTGQNITLTDDSYNGEVTTYDWQLPGATPSSSTSANPTVTYNTPGLYSVTMNISNAQGSDSFSRTDYIRVISGTADVNSFFSFEGFEETDEDYIIFSDGSGNTWEETSSAFTGSSAIMINNFSGNPTGSIDEFLLPSVNLTLMSSPKIYFKLAYKESSGSENDNLRIFVSRDCGAQWSMRYTKSGSSLATVSGTTSSSYAPSSTSDWEEIEVNLSSFVDDEHVLVKFWNKSDAGNNIYIDDIQISGPQGISDQALELNLEVVPNPASESAQIRLQPRNAGEFNISVADVAGKHVADIYTGTLSAEKTSLDIPQNILAVPGVYFISVQHSGGTGVKKLIVQ